ncbi:MAG: hypothetical protein ABIH11_07190 [Candidatus Altiarchaeota archaeon]
MRDLLADIKFRWFDESALLTDDRRELVELFLDSIGITSDVARDLIEVLVNAKTKDVSLGAGEIKILILELRRRRKSKDPMWGLTDRNLQVWLKYFQNIRLIDNFAGKYRFTSNKPPSRAFKDYTMEVVKESAAFTERVLKRIEEVYELK